LTFKFKARKRKFFATVGEWGKEIVLNKWAFTGDVPCVIYTKIICLNWKSVLHAWTKIAQVNRTNKKNKIK
jgi:hypothetical protein